MLFLLSGAPAVAAESKEPTAPMMAEDTAVITELNYFSNFNISAYSITVGAMEVRADKMGPPCPGAEAGKRIVARYDNKLMYLGDEKARCKLTIRRMEFTGPPQPH
ncbi:MAG: hypothetical protein ACOYXU_04585 [Nitrospirota bacterium]